MKNIIPVIVCIVLLSLVIFANFIFLPENYLWQSKGVEILRVNTKSGKIYLRGKLIAQDNDLKGMRLR